MSITKPFFNNRLVATLHDSRFSEDIELKDRYTTSDIIIQLEKIYSNRNLNPWDAIIGYYMQVLVPKSPSISLRSNKKYLTKRFYFSVLNTIRRDFYYCSGTYFKDYKKWKSCIINNINKYYWINGTPILDQEYLLI